MAVSLLFSGVLAAQTPPEPSAPAGQVVSAAPTELAIPPDVRPAVPVKDAERKGVEVTSVALDLHLVPAEAREEAHATLVLRNRTDKPMARIPLQISSTLHWLSAFAAMGKQLKAIPFTQSPTTSDADHTGYAQEAVFTPETPLAAGETLTLSVFYGGEIPASADRLELIGAPHDRAIATDWDAITSTSDRFVTSLRGFGNVLWYPVAEPPALFGNGNELFDLIAQDRRRNAQVSMRLRLTVEYVGDPPDAVIFNGQLRPLEHGPDTDNEVVSETHGVATADFPAAPIGFRTPSLFLTAQQAVTTPDQLLTTITPQPDAAVPYAAAAASLQPMLAGFLGETPRTPLLLLDHPGEPFEDAAFLVAELSAAADPANIAPKLVRALTHAWMSPQSRTVPPTSLWIAEGLPEFMSLAWTERTQSREAAIGVLRHASSLIALAEPAADQDTHTAQPLTEAYSDVFLRLKSGFVFWQLREMLGDQAFSRGLTAFRHSVALNAAYDRDPKALQAAFEKASGKDLGWFFDDWVYHDRGLPDLTIVQANPRALPVRAGRSGGYIVAVEVRNEGEAAAEVPVTVRSGLLSATERLRIPAHASASTRVVFEGTPAVVEVNDGSVPEVRSTTHTYTFPVTAEAP